MYKFISNLIISYSSSFIGFVIILLSARLIGAEQFSWIAVGLAIGGFIIPLISLGSEQTFVRDAVIANNSDTVEQIVISSFCTRVTVALLVSLLLFLGSLGYTDSLLDCVAVISLSLWVGLQGLYPSSWFDYQHATRRQNIIVLVERTVSLSFVLGIYILPLSFRTAALIGVLLLTTRLLSIVIQVSIWWSAYAKHPFQMRLLFPIRKMPGINFRVTFTLVSNAILIYGNQLILGRSAGSVDLSSYSLAFQVICLIFLYQALVIRLLSRQIADVCASKAKILRTAFSYAILAAGGSIILGLIAIEIVRYLPLFLADDRFKLMSQFMPLLYVWVVIVGAGQVISRFLLVLHQETFYLASSIVSGLFALPLGLLLIPSYGGIAVAAILLTVTGVVVILNTSRLIHVVRSKQG
ncbi:MAG: oligosaccharide flippase family protein [Pseudomonadota bacterium]